MRMRIRSVIFRLLAAIFCILIIFFVILPMIEEGYRQYYGTDSIYLITGTGIPVLLSLALFMAVLWLFSRDGLKGYFEEENGKGIRADFSGKKKCLAGLLSLFFTAAGILGSMCWYQRFTMDGVEYRCFFHQKKYAWQDVECFTLKADSQGVLMFEFQMEDGKKRSFNGGSLWCIEYFGKGFEEKFPEDVYSYALWLGEELGSRKIPLKAEGGWEKLEEKLEYESWKRLAEDVRGRYEEAAAYRN